MQRIEQLEHQARVKNYQIKMALAKEYEQSIKEKQRRKEEDFKNNEEIERRQLDIGTKLFLEDNLGVNNKTMDYQRRHEEFMRKQADVQNYYKKNVLYPQNSKLSKSDQALERDLKQIERDNLKQQNMIEMKKNMRKYEFQKGLQLQILEKRKAQDMKKAIDKKDLIYLKNTRTGLQNGTSGEQENGYQK